MNIDINKYDLFIFDLDDTIVISENIIMKHEIKHYQKN